MANTTITGGGLAPSNSSASNSTYFSLNFSTSESETKNSNFCTVDVGATENKSHAAESTIELVANWFLSKEAMSNKKLQKICYYAYCWYIVFFNDLEAINSDCSEGVRTLFPEKFQAWIHGPVLPQLYHKYKEYGWQDIPQATKPAFPNEIESLLQQVWDAYGHCSADDLEMLSHSEMPWINARKGIGRGEACTNEISCIDILLYYSKVE